MYLHIYSLYIPVNRKTICHKGGPIIYYRQNLFLVYREIINLQMHYVVVANMLT